LKGLISKLKAEDPELKAEIEPAKPFERPPFFTSPEELIVKSSAKWHEYVTGKKPKYDPSGGAYPYGGTDAAFLSKAGTKCVVYGPGEHFKKTTEERIKISSVITASKIFALTAADICDARL
jgi:acetylornithine deacetylase/succinyl-diaminopimelate desuccinylase-like protein